MIKSLKSSILFILLAITFSSFCIEIPKSTKSVYVVFRFDDYSAISLTELELKIINVFRRNEGSVTFSVIPFRCAGDVHDTSPQEIIPLNQAKADILRTAVIDGTLEIALHGYSHQTIDSEYMTELKGMDYGSQLERLAKGKYLLEELTGSKVTSFVPPWNTYDLNTLQAIEKLGFSTISAGMVGEATEDSKLFFLPTSSNLSQVRKAIRDARRLSYFQPIIVILFHEYDFKEIDEKNGTVTFKEFSDILSWVTSQEDVRLLKISEATELFKNIDASRYMLNMRNFLLSRQLLPPVLKERETHLFLRNNILLYRIVKFGGFYLLIVCFWLIVTFLLGFIVFPRFPYMMKIVMAGSIVLSVGILVYVVHDLYLSFAGMMVSTGSVGISIGLCLNYFYFKKKSLSSSGFKT